ncbi:MAG: hypothetical protein JSU07_06320 [Bacteroidetes bacterium]|nr:hypothetical protein [Bacteroidota bacterium]
MEIEKFLNNSIPKRLKNIRIVITIGLILSMLLTFNLWHENREFPTVPMLNFKIDLSFIHLPLFIMSIVFLLFSVLTDKPRVYLVFAILFNILLVLLDVNRLQPWFYYYNLILFILLFYNGRVDNPNKHTSLFIIIQIIICSVYIFNGIFKITNNFAESGYLNIVAYYKHLISNKHYTHFENAGKFVGPYLIACGALILFRELRFIGVFISAILHVFLLIILFPGGINFDYGIWFMNFVFLLVIPFLFMGTTKQRHFNFSLLFQNVLFYVGIALFYALPFLNFYNKWPDYLSGNFYNNKTIEVAINKSSNKLSYFQKYFITNERNILNLNVGKWFAVELNSECFLNETQLDKIKECLKK